MTTVSIKRMVGGGERGKWGQEDWQERVMSVFMFTCIKLDKCRGSSASVSECTSTNARLQVCMQACVPLRMNKNGEVEEKKRWERRTKSVYVYGGG